LEPACLRKWYEALTRDDQPKPVDLIFVMAGRIARKHYGLELFRTGMAPRLVLSTERFEVSKMSGFGLARFDELIALRDRTPADQRFFYWKMDASGESIEKRKIPRWNTYGEILGLRQFLQEEKAQKVMMVSSALHLRRVALTVAKVFRNAPVEFLYCPVPPNLDGLSADGWWTRPGERRYVVQETMKLTGYRTILALPEWAIRLLMRLKD
jgi:hypothetical protein